MKHESEFGIVSAGNTVDVRSINIDGKNIKVDKIVEGFMHLRVKQDNVNHKLILQPLDENLKPIGNKQIVFDFQEKVTIDKKGKKRYTRRLLLSDDKNLAKMQKKALGDWSVESILLVHGTLYTCFKDMFRDSPELESRFIKLVGDAEHLGQNPTKSAAYLVFFLLQDTKGGGTAFVSAKRYMITLLRHERKLVKLKSDLDDLLNDSERLSKLTPEELKALKETHKKIETELKNLRERIIVFLEDHFTSMNRAKNHKNKIVICMEVTKRYLERLLGGKEGIKRVGKTVAIGTLVGLIFPRVVAETIMTLDISILEEILARDAKTFAALMSNEELQLGIGLSLSAITFALLNLDMHRFVKMGTAETAETARAPTGVSHTEHKSSLVNEFFGQLFDLKMILATFLSGFGMLLKAIADAPFYTTEEIAEEISKQVHEKLGETAGVIWDMTAGYRIPGLDMTGFEVASTVLLQGNGGVIQLITTAVTKAVEYMISEVIKPLVEPVISEYTYYIVDALTA